MAADYIAISSTNRPNLGNQVIGAANLLRDLRDLVDAINDAGQHMFNGGDYTMLEAQFGLQAGQGANFLTLVAQVHEILSTSTDVTGANRLSRLDEFVARLAGQ